MTDNTKKKIHVAVLMGGKSHEHGISVLSGKAVFNNLDKKRYSCRALLITPRGKIKLLPENTFPTDELWDTTKETSYLQSFSELQRSGIDVAVLALHGKGGEDGAIQGFLETLDIPYTHSGVLSSAVSMNKIFTKQIYFANKIPFPPSVVVREKDDLKEKIDEVDFGWPLIVKPPSLGSSYGIKIVENIVQLETALSELWNIDKEAIVEKYFKGKEFTCVVINRKYGEPAEAMPVTEIVPETSPFFDYNAKYTAGATQEITPAQIDDELAEQIRDYAGRCHEILMCEGVSRTDFILSGEGDLYILETNTIPGMTETSFVPQVARVSGMTFGDFLDLLINYAMEKGVSKPELNNQYSTRNFQL